VVKVTGATRGMHNVIRQKQKRRARSTESIKKTGEGQKKADRRGLRDVVETNKKIFNKTPKLVEKCRGLKKSSFARSC